ncbi:Phosphoribosylformylglycinamidine synthase subunit PurL [Poriferisphaera corsica]|uniref:Phosphoribosylformylglycinamidine synthase subunit PurL n=1 Tax=Poriferisphaera corsica TaxID=2528020 RepID=A0A517YU59_9BACT|nr:phosphoribosylformylglycinamidine synthase subunit PurS [Poriferisphaera corsica]QDU33739.1 Phosphoribosylformylglycinamidine synthase subunit PurL [Poriferisphaera corsica]
MTTPTDADRANVSEMMKVARVEVRPKAGEIDPEGMKVLAEAQGVLAGVKEVKARGLYLVEGPLSDEQIDKVAGELLADQVNQRYTIGADAIGDDAVSVEVHFKPGVMDPVAQSTKDAIVEMLNGVDVDTVDVSTGKRFDFVMEAGAAKLSEAELDAFAERYLANPVIQDIHHDQYHPSEFVHGHRYELNLGHVAIRELDDEGLMKLSREGHLFLSLTEMKCVQEYYQKADREPTDIELETLAQTWSEHCVHKTLKSSVRLSEEGGVSIPTLKKETIGDRKGHKVNEDGSVTVDNLLKYTVAAATFELMEEEPYKSWCISVFEDNAGIVKFDEEDAVCIKVETHNHPSAIEPYGGAATGIGGCIRDIMGTGLSAKPIANTDSFCVAMPDTAKLPKGVIHPKRTLEQITAGVRDYGNRMGIPTVNGMVYFHEDFVGNPLVFAGCVGLMPNDKCFGDAAPGDRIIALGGATGRDGIHGATFSSAELTDTHADEFSHAVQIGNAITQKKTMDVILQARDQEDGPLYSAITDCGAGGFSSAVGEMGEKVGANVQLDQAPLKYRGLSYTEIWISEAQERMVMSVPVEKIDRLKAMCAAENVDFCDLGEFGCVENDEPMLTLNYRGTEVGKLSMKLMHEGIPTPLREAKWDSEKAGGFASGKGDVKDLPGELKGVLKGMLGSPNIASKHWIVRQYDHEVQGGSAVKPLVGPCQDGPGDASVVRPKLGSMKGIALSCGMGAHMSEKATAAGVAKDGDSYWATLAAIDEAVRNAVCVGADPTHIAILDNFCWPGCDDAYLMGSLVRAAEACYDGAMAYKTPFVSGKDSLNNQFTTDEGVRYTIPQTLLLSAMGMVEDVRKCVTMDAKAAGNVLLVVGKTDSAMGGSSYCTVYGDQSRNMMIPKVDLEIGPRTARAVAGLIDRGLVKSAHDCSEGGMLVAAAEMAFAGRVGLDLEIKGVPSDEALDTIAACYAETPSRYLIEVASEDVNAVVSQLKEAGIAFGQVGVFGEGDRLTVASEKDGRVMDASLAELVEAWRETLDW